MTAVPGGNGRTFRYLLARSARRCMFDVNSNHGYVYRQDCAPDFIYSTVESIAKPGTCAYYENKGGPCHRYGTIPSRSRGTEMDQSLISRDEINNLGPAGAVTSHLQIFMPKSCMFPSL